MPEASVTWTQAEAVVGGSCNFSQIRGAAFCRCGGAARRKKCVYLEKKTVKISSSRLESSVKFA